VRLRDSSPACLGRSYPKGSLRRGDCSPLKGALLALSEAGELLLSPKETALRQELSLEKGVSFRTPCTTPCFQNRASVFLFYSSSFCSFFYLQKAGAIKRELRIKLGKEL
jgi:hypothetical protein